MATFKVVVYACKHWEELIICKNFSCGFTLFTVKPHVVSLYYIYCKTSILWRAKRLAKYLQYNKALLNQVFFGVTETIFCLLLCCGVGIVFSLLCCIIGWLHASTTPRNYHHFEVLFCMFYYQWGKECCSLLSRTLLYRCSLYQVASIVEAFFRQFFFWSFMQIFGITHFTVINGNKVGVDLVFQIQTLICFLM